MPKKRTVEGAGSRPDDDTRHGQGQRAGFRRWFCGARPMRRKRGAPSAEPGRGRAVAGPHGVICRQAWQGALEGKA
jgi:hypothetical protein